MSPHIPDLYIIQRTRQLMPRLFLHLTFMQNTIASITDELRTFQARFEDAVATHQKELKRLNDHIKELTREKELVGREVSICL